VSRPPFIDAHVHLWDLAALRYPWLTPPFAEDGPNGSVERIARDYGVDEYLADSAGWDVAGIVHVDAGAAPDQALAETDWLQGLADERGMPNAIVAFADLGAPDVDQLLMAHAARANVRGIRHIVNWHPDPRRTYTPRDVTRDPAWAQGFALLGRHGLSYDLQCYPAQMPGLAELLARHPDVPVIVNHAGMGVDTDTAGVAEWRDGMTALAALPHVSVKLSGFGFIHRDWRPAQIRPYFLQAIDLFGVERCMVASDMPTDTLFGGFAKHLDAYDAFTADFSDDERRDLFGRNADRIYRLGLEL
jgi:predicted TIM-barrel fold metal-dependent hydrolase